MRRRGFCAWLGTACFLSALMLGTPPAAAGTASAPPSATPDPLCAVADSLLAAGKLDSAVELYAALGSACQSDSEFVTRRKNAAADLLTAAMDIDAAPVDEPPAAKAEAEARARDKRSMLEAAAVLDPTNTDVTAELEKLDQVVSPPSRSLCDVGYDLLARGDLAGAKAQFDAASGNDATKKCAQAGLVAVAEAEAALPPNRLTTAVTGVLLPWLTLAAAGVLAALILTVVWSAHFRQPIAAASKHRDIVFAAGLVCGVMALLAAGLLVVASVTGALSFATSRSPVVLGWSLVLLATSSSLLIGWAQGQRRRLSIGPLTTSAGPDAADLTALVGSEFTALVGERSAGIYQVSGTDVKDSPLTQVTALIPNQMLKALGDIWTKLTPGVDFQLTGHVHLPDDGRPVIQLRLRRGASLDVHESIELEGLFADIGARRSRDIATMIAAWTVEKFMGALDREAKARLYGATIGRSIGLNAIAARQPLTSPARMSLLTAATAADPHNQAAKFGLLAARLLTKPEMAWTPDVLYPEKIQGLMDFEQHLPEEFKELPLAWRTEYTLGAALANLGQASLRTGAPHPEALTRAKNCMDELRSKLPPPQRPETREPDLDTTLAERLRELSTEVLNTVSVSAAAQEGATGDPAGKATEADKTPCVEEPRLQFTRACMFGAAYTWAAQNQLDRQRDEDQAQQELRQTRQKQKDEMLIRCLAHLRRAFVDPSLIAAATGDPYLTDVCGRREYRDLVREMTPPAKAGKAAEK